MGVYCYGCSCVPCEICADSLKWNSGSSFVFLGHSISIISGVCRIVVHNRETPNVSASSILTGAMTLSKKFHALMERSVLLFICVLCSYCAPPSPSKCTLAPIAAICSRGRAKQRYHSHTPPKKEKINNGPYPNSRLRPPQLLPPPSNNFHHMSPIQLKRLQPKLHRPALPKLPRIKPPHIPHKHAPQLITGRQPLHLHNPLRSHDSRERNSTKPIRHSRMRIRGLRP